MEEKLAGVALQPGPQFASAQQQMNVARILEVGLAKDARAPVGGTVAVRRREGIETGQAEAALREAGRGGAAHRSKAKDDYIAVAIHAVDG